MQLWEHRKEMTSLATKRKHVEREVLNNFSLPDTARGQKVVRVAASRGNNLHEVQTPEGEAYLASMPTKFRRHVWIKRGDFVVTEPIAEGVRVRAEIVSVLLNDQIDHLVRQGVWPAAFLPDLRARQGLTRLATGEDTGGGVPADMLPPSGSEDEEAEAADPEADAEADTAESLSPP